MLYTSNSTRQDTQLAYKVRVFPWAELSLAAKELIVWRKGFFLHKSELVAMLDEDRNYLYRDACRFKILWTYNCIPTMEEWNKKHDKFHIFVDLRVSPAIADGPVALLDFKIPSASLRREF